MKINTIQFLVTISHNIKFGTAQKLPNGAFNNIAKAIRKVMKSIQWRGFWCRWAS